MRNRRRGAARWWALAVVVTLMVASCSDNGPTAASAEPDDDSSGTAQTTSAGNGGAEEGSGGQGSSSESGSCDGDSGASVDGPTNEAQSVDIDGVEVDFAVYPRPDHEGDPWSQWGQGIVLPDGRFLAGMGDHLGRDGNSYLFVYDPESGEMTRFADVQSLVGHEEGSWGYGKIHAQMVQPTCDSVIIATYWGTRRDIEYGGSYTGDVLLRLDTGTLEVESLGVPIEGHGIPSMATAGGLVYGEAAAPDPEAPPEVGTFFVYDPETNEVVYQVDEPTHTGFRSIMVGPDGSAYVAGADSGLLRYEPGGELAPYDETLPAGFLRAVAAPTGEGTVYGVTTESESWFAMRPDGGIDDLGPLRDYTTSIAMLPDGRIVYVPGAHGHSWENGTPVYAFDPESGTDEVLVELNETAEQELGLTLGGTYSVSVDAERNRLFIAFNAGADDESPWGDVVLATIHL